MRHLFQPKVLNQAALAAAASTLLCYPRLALWEARPFPIWFPLTAIFICGITLWSFVFAWRKPYTDRPIFLAKFDPKLFLGATIGGIGLSLACRLWLDPALRPALPEDYPSDWQHWLAMAAFAFAFGQLFLTFAPCDWLMRLCRNPRITVVLVAAFGAGIAAMKLESHADLIYPTMFAGFLTTRFLSALLAAIFYLRGGMALAWWWGFLLELRLLPELL